MDKDKEAKDANRDPLTGAPGAHPVGTGVGAALGGAAAGAAVGTVAGPVGTVAGAAVGAIVGGLAGKGVAEKLDPTVEEAYWKTNYVHETYYEPGVAYDQYAPAYRTGFEGRSKYQGRTFEEVERDLQKEYEQRKGGSKFRWEEAKSPARAAWNRGK